MLGISIASVMELAETGPEICGSERGKGQQCGDDSRPTLILNDAGADESNRSGSNIQSTKVCAQYAVCTVLKSPFKASMPPQKAHDTVDCDETPRSATERGPGLSNSSKECKQ